MYFLPFCGLSTVSGSILPLHIEKVTDLTHILLSLSAGFTAKGKIVSLFLEPSQILFLWPSPTKQENLYSAPDGPLIFYYDTVLKTSALLSLGFICTFLTDYHKVRWFSPNALSCAFWHSSWWSACTLCKNSAWFTDALVPQISCLTHSQFFIIFRVCTFCAPHYLILDPGEVFVCCTYNISKAFREGCMEGRVQMFFGEIFIGDVDQQDASSLWLSIPPSFPLRCPGLREVQKGTGNSSVGFDRESKNPSWLYYCAPVVHFTPCMSRHRRGDVDKQLRCWISVSVKLPDPSLMFSFQRMSCSSTLNLKRCLLFGWWWVSDWTCTAFQCTYLQV